MGFYSVQRLNRYLRPMVIVKYSSLPASKVRNLNFKQCKLKYSPLESI